MLAKLFVNINKALRIAILHQYILNRYITLLALISVMKKATNITANVIPKPCSFIMLSESEKTATVCQHNDAFYYITIVILFTIISIFS